MKIIWAIDPFERTVQPDQTAVSSLKNWKDVAGARIQPVYVMDSETVADDLSGCSPRMLKAARKAAIHLINNELKAAWAERPAVLVAHSPTVRGAVERLLQFTHAEKADLIVVSSHGRAGLSKAIMGSFAETLLSLSTVPVLFLSEASAQGPIPSARPRVLFASDFSSLAHKAFLTFVEHTKRLGASLTIYHRLEPGPELVLMTAAPGMIPYSSKEESERRESEERLKTEAWAKWARDQGVNAEVFIDRSRGQTSDLILVAAREGGASMIGVATENDVFKSFFLGAVAKHVFREREISVWAAGPSFQRVSSNKADEAVKKDRFNEHQHRHF